MKKLILLCGLLALVSCKKELEKPKKFIERDKMVDILYDFALLGGIDNTSAFYADTTLSIVRADAVLKKYQIDSLTFAQNNRYYIELGNESYFEIQEDIRKRLEEKKAELAALEKEEQEKKERLEADEKAKAIKLKVTADTLDTKVLRSRTQE
ncbi:DUF4296 domain-containing protein [Flavobacterium sp. JP2137]|uniref:DUF4296 domain-containing protein n=1 Tax=Flavobacterium sp. JP2137 TaxID=3414510 RepID=UPI003D300EEF